MIELSPNTAFMVYLCLTFFLLLGIWGFQHFAVRRSPSIPPQQLLFVCEYCHFAYLAESDREVNQCPQCKAFNKNNLYEPGK